MTKSDRKIMEILEAFDLTRCAHSAAQLTGVDEKTVARYVAIRDAGGDPTGRPVTRPKIDPFAEKIEQLVEASAGKVRADVVHERLVAMGFTGTDRTTRRAVARAKAAWKAGHRRKYRPWIPDPGMWCQFDWGEGPKVAGRRTQLFCGWLSWSRFRVVIPVWDQTLGTLVSCVDMMLRRIGGAPTYLLTDNPRTVTMDRVAGVPVRHPDIVSMGRHYGCKVETCEPFDPESKGGSENTVKIAKAVLVPTSANLRPEYASFAELADACFEWCERVNARVHRETAVTPIARLAIERAYLHVLPERPHALALGEERIVESDQTVRFGSVRYSTPDGHQGTRVWMRVVSDELRHCSDEVRAGRDHPRPALHAGESADPRRALLRRPVHRVAPAAEDPAADRDRGRVPRAGRRCASLAGGGRLDRRHPDSGQDGQGPRARRRPGSAEGRRDPRAGGDRGPVR
ncbi:MAG: family transposase [Amycolatopsis sp.]|uniref:IS21 family transposase n=1 Tax=Amycolatopsis sp. TaxID=37632 RepID=UPI0026104434|nr:IS21 family transposase [Amycolatopsis sp.]MCU1686709.1 family transposase [Amycolatopsis sp.]